MHRRIICVATLLASLIAGAACDDNTKLRSPAAPTPAPAPPPPSSPTDLAGTYTVSIEADGKCVDLPQDVKKRTYLATLGVTPYSYLSIFIVGGGFTRPTGVGDLWSDGRISWNTFDVGCGDSYREPLGTSRSLMICGTGIAQAAGATITANISGEILVEWVEPDPLGDGEMQGRSMCTGIHHLTFQRTASN